MQNPPSRTTHVDAFVITSAFAPASANKSRGCVILITFYTSTLCTVTLWTTTSIMASIIVDTGQHDDNGSIPSSSDNNQASEDVSATSQKAGDYATEVDPFDDTPAEDYDFSSDDVDSYVSPISATYRDKFPAFEVVYWDANQNLLKRHAQLAFKRLSLPDYIISAHQIVELCDMCQQLFRHSYLLEASVAKSWKRPRRDVSMVLQGEHRTVNWRNSLNHHESPLALCVTAENGCILCTAFIHARMGPGNPNDQRRELFAELSRASSTNQNYGAGIVDIAGWNNRISVSLQFPKLTAPFLGPLSFKTEVSWEQNTCKSSL